MKKRHIRMKLIGTVVIAAAFLVKITPIPVFAQSYKNTEEKEAVETIVEQITEPATEINLVTEAETEAEIELDTELVIEPDTEPKEEAYGPLTPDGNLTLVDDYGSIEAKEKQFITVVTKKGNYFYIIIDRNDQGNETVHFLNMVDESDLLSLMEDEEAQEYVESISSLDEEATQKEEEVKKETSEVDNPKEKSQGSSSKGILVLLLVVTIGGIAVYRYFKKTKKKDVKKSGPDPDADYTDEEDFLSELQEDDFYDEAEDVEITEEYEEENHEE